MNGGNLVFNNMPEILMQTTPFMRLEGVIEAREILPSIIRNCLFS